MHWSFQRSLNIQRDGLKHYQVDKLSEPCSKTTLPQKAHFFLWDIIFFSSVLGFFNFRFLFKSYLLKNLTTHLGIKKKIDKWIKIHFNYISISRKTFFFSNYLFKTKTFFWILGRNKAISYFSFLHTECLRVIQPAVSGQIYTSKIGQIAKM